MTDRIPIIAAETIGKSHCYDQVVIYARRVGFDGLEWVTTWGRDRTHCAAAALIGEFIGRGVVKPLEEKDAEIERLKAAVEDEADMAACGRSLMEAIAAVTAEGSGLLAGWHPAEDPAEIVTDLAEMLRQASSDADRLKATADTAAVRDVLARRRRQIEKGYDADHDDHHVGGEIISGEWGAIRRLTGACAWLKGATVDEVAAPRLARRYRELLVDAAAMTIAEIERLDRLDLEVGGGGTTNSETVA